MIDIDEVNLASLVIGGIDTMDHPDYCDAYFEKGNYNNGTPLTDEELEGLAELDPQLLNEMVLNTIY